MSELQATRNIVHRLLTPKTKRPAAPQPAADLTELIQNARFLESLFPAWVFVLNNTQHGQALYVSSNAQTILGYAADYLKSLSPAAYFELVHPDDAKGVRLALEHFHAWAAPRPPAAPTDYRFALHYRLRTPNRGYIYVIAEQHAFQNRVGQYTHFALLKRGAKQQFTGVRLETYQLKNGDYRKTGEYVPRAGGAAITSREKEVLRCIQEGMTSKQIADQLFISLNTVRNHRSNIFAKAGAQNMVHLVKLAEASGWI